MQRRKFLALAGVGLTSVLSLPNLSYLTASYKEAGVGLILNEFYYLNLDKEGVIQFVGDFLRTKSEAEMYYLKIKLRLYHLLRVRADDSVVVSELAHNYLFSTDFFRNKMNENMEVKYLGLYNPHKLPCSNAFSHIYYPPTV